jgi:2-hydroxycyclohexanecarboxyl-CoA dehydrogenase
MRFEGKIAMVTGGAQGIGKAIVEAFAREGARLAIADIRKDLAETLAASLGAQALAVKMDVTDYREVDGGVNLVLEKLGGIDILVNNAGWDMPGDFTAQSEEFWANILDLNLKGPIIASNIVIKSMIKRRRGGRIINISSVAAGGTPRQVVYSAAKGGVETLTKSLALAYAGYNITVNCVAPTATETPALKEAFEKNPNLREDMLKTRLFRRFSKPEEMAPPVLFFASDEAALITGQVLAVGAVY